VPFQLNDTIQLVSFEQYKQPYSTSVVYILFIQTTLTE